MAIERAVSKSVDHYNNVPSADTVVASKGAEPRKTLRRTDSVASMNFSLFGKPGEGEYWSDQAIAPLRNP